MLQQISQTVTVFAASPHLQSEQIDTVVTIPTFKRADHVLKTVESVHAQGRTDKTAIVVIENDAESRTGAKALAGLFEAGQRNGVVIIAHERGNCQAYNAGWLTAQTLFSNLQWIAILDDDEIAGTDWLSNHKSTLLSLGADICGGPQFPVFEGNPNERLKRHPVFVPHYSSTGIVETLFSSGNLVMRADVLRTMAQPRLDLAFNFTGGGDTDFLRRAKAAGKQLAWCNEAPVYETIPESRVTRRWITKRALRNGELSARIEHRKRASEPFGRTKTVAHSLALAAFALPRAILAFPKTGSLLGAAYPIHIAAGRLASELGYQNEQYRNPTD